MSHAIFICCGSPLPQTEIVYDEHSSSVVLLLSSTQAVILAKSSNIRFLRQLRMLIYISKGSSHFIQSDYQERRDTQRTMPKRFWTRFVEYSDYLYARYVCTGTTNHPQKKSSADYGAQHDDLGAGASHKNGWGKEPPNGQLVVRLVKLTGWRSSS